jgi:uncharacterized protein (TIGR04255 family)
MTRSRQLNIEVEESFPHLPMAPVVEAVIHWQARPQAAIEPDAFRQRLVEMLPDFVNPTPMRLFQFEAHLEAAAGAESTRRETWVGLRLASRDERYIAQFKTDGFALSRLAPYEKWQTFAAEARRLWRVFVEVAAPVEVQRLGVRFINRIGLANSDEVGKLLTRPPVRLGSLGLPVRNFVYQSTHDVPGWPYRLNIVDTIQVEMLPEAPGPSLILDIDAFTTRPIDIGDAELENHLERLRWLKNKAFFNLMTKSAIRRFGKGSR